MSLLPPDAVLRFAESQRARVFPLAYRTNFQPCIKNNLQLASSEPGQIHAWAREFQNCNWGLACGPESGRLVLDVDAAGVNGHAHDGRKWLDAMMQLHGSGWLDTVAVRTPGGGGLHLHYRWPANITKITSRPSSFANGVDVRASGALACIPPSIVVLTDGNEGEYVWEKGDETTTPAALPEWLLELLLAPAQPASQLPTLQGQNGNGKVLEGTRHVTLFRFAAGLRSQGKSESEIFTLAAAENQARYQPPLPDADVKKAVGSATKYPAGPGVVVNSKILQNPAPAQPAAQQISLIKTLDEYRAITPEKVEWVVAGLAARGAMTNLDAKIKTGKTTWLLAMAKAILMGEPFMGLATNRAGVLFATEQPGSSFRPALERAGLAAGSNLHILIWQDTLQLAWEAVTAMIAGYCAQRADIGVLIIDTLGQFAGLPASGENDSATVLQVMRPLQAMLSQRLAIINSLHSRKSLGEVGDSARGSSQIGGSADILLSLRRVPGNQSKNLRRLEAISRFDETPSELLIELENGIYVSRGTSSAVSQETAQRWLEENLPATADDALTLEQLLDAAADAEITRSTLQRALDGPCAGKVGSGHKNSPFRYYRAAVRKVTLGGKLII